MKDLYTKNLEALFSVNPILGAKLFAIKENSRFNVFQGKDPIDINIYDTKTNETIYQFPIDETQQYIERLQKNYNLFPVLFFYGIGNGILYQALLQNVSLKHLVIFEPNLELIYIALNFIDISEEIRKERIIIEHSENFSFPKALKIIYKGDIKPYAKIYNLHILTNYYEKHYSDDILSINATILKAYKHMVIGHGNDATDSLIGIEQHIYNIPQMLKNYKTKELLKSKNSDMAIIVSTGPSLKKQLPLLKQYQDYATLICIDASLPILQEHNIKPDIVVSMERVEATSKFFENIDKEFAKDIYFVVSSLTHRKTVENLKEFKLLLSMRPLAYMRYYELDNFGYLGSGMSAANMGYQLAFLMRFQRIVLIGQDLAYADDGQSHAKGHIFGENEVKHSETDLEVVRYGGKGTIRTTYVWDMFRNYFEQEIYEAQQHNVETYNCTEGGAHIAGSIERPFQEVLESFADRSKKKNQISLHKIQKEEYKKLLRKAYIKTEEMLQYGIEFKKEIENLFLESAPVCEKIETQSKDEIDYDELLKLLEKIDTIKDKVESPEFSKMYIDTVQSYIFHQELEFAKIMIQPSGTQEQKREKLVQWIQKHQYWLFSLAGGIDAQLTAISRGKSNLILNCKELNCL